MAGQDHDPSGRGGGIRLRPADRRPEAFFWATQGGAELDLLLCHEGRRVGYECKYAEQPRLTRSMRVAMEDLRLDALFVICPGSVRAPVAPGVEVVGIEAFAERAPSGL